MRAVRVNQNTVVVARKNQNSELKGARMLHIAEGNCSGGYFATSEPFHITHSYFFYSLCQILITAA